MVDHGHMLFSLLILLNVVFFFLGYIVGKLQNKSVISYENASPNKKSHKVSTNSNKIVIDEAKYITTINTKGMEKKFDNLGETTQTNENIDNNINKLKNIKK